MTNENDPIMSQDGGCGGGDDGVADRIAFGRRLLVLLGFDANSPLLGRERWVPWAIMGVAALLGFALPRQQATPAWWPYATIAGLSGAFLAFLTAYVFEVRERRGAERKQMLGGFWLTPAAAELREKGHPLDEILKRNRFEAGRVWPPAARGMLFACALAALVLFAFGLAATVSSVARGGGGDRATPLAAAADTLVEAAEKAVAAGTMVRGVPGPLPDPVSKARSDFIDAWGKAGAQEKAALPVEDLYRALRWVIDTYRHAGDMGKAEDWAKKSKEYFEGRNDRKHHLEAMLDLAGVYQELSVHAHRKPAEVQRLADQARTLTAQILSKQDSTAGEFDAARAEALFDLSDVHYHLAKPSSGNLMEAWNADQLLTAHARITEALRLAPGNLRYETQQARIVQQIARHDSYKAESRWAEAREQALAGLRRRKAEIDGATVSVSTRRMARNALAVLTRDSILATWSALDPGARRARAEALLEELDTFALQPQRDCMEDIRNSRFAGEFRFEALLDLTEMYAVRLQILEALAPEGERARGAYKQVETNLMAAWDAARLDEQKVQPRVVVTALDQSPAFLGISEQRLKDLKDKPK